VYDEWKEWATPKQCEYIDAVMKAGSIRGAARELGVHQKSVQTAIKLARKTAITHGFSPEHDMTKTTPEGYINKGVSTLYNADGEIKAQWVKTEREKEKQTQLILDMIRDAAEELKGKSPRIKCPKVDNSDYIANYMIPDIHTGMFAWAEETGDDYDLKIAEEFLIGAVTRLVDATPPTETCIIRNLGDFFHTDNMNNQTSRSGNLLDVDTRWSKVLMVGFKMMCTVIELALGQHKAVNVINSIGNHDDQTSVMLSIALDAYFNNNRRVAVDKSPAKFHYNQFGKCAFGQTHGDSVKPQALGPIMATDRPKLWGDTEHRYWFTGHIHTQNVWEFPGCIVESFNTLAAKDAWTASKFRSSRSLSSLVFHTEYGLSERYIVDVSRLRK